MRTAILSSAPASESRTPSSPASSGRFGSPLKMSASCFGEDCAVVVVAFGQRLRFRASRLRSCVRAGADLRTFHRVVAAPPGTGTRSAEGCSASCKIVFVADTNCRLVA